MTAVFCDTCVGSATVSTWGCLSHTQQLLHCFNTAIKCRHSAEAAGPTHSPWHCRKGPSVWGENRHYRMYSSTGEHTTLFTYTVLLLITQTPNNFPLTEVGRSKNKENVSAENTMWREQVGQLPSDGDFQLLAYTFGSERECARWVSLFQTAS